MLILFIVAKIYYKKILTIQTPQWWGPTHPTHFQHPHNGRPPPQQGVIHPLPSQYILLYIFNENLNFISCTFFQPYYKFINFEKKNEKALILSQVQVLL